jgi:hypothetical protein
MRTRPQLPFSLNRRVHVCGILSVGLAATWPRVLLAQSPAEDAVKVGERWVYDTKDETTGFPKATYSHVVTEVSPKEIVVSLTFRGQSSSSLVVYDHDWNLIENSTVKFKPNNGQGIRRPLSVGKEWRAEYEARNSTSGVAVKGSLLNKVAAQEMITTPAGDFDTFKVETRVREFNTANPSRLFQLENVIWYAPQVNRWVRRQFVTKVQNRTTASTSEELAEFSRKL